MVEVPAKPTPGATLRTGSRVSAYEVEKLLGTGGMGSVYRARHVLDEHQVALKVLREDQLEQERAVDRMMREASILATVAHGGIPRFYECGLLGDGRPWIAMELVQGTPLAVRLHEGPLPHGDVMSIVGAVAGVLEAAHQRGVTHRDLKPDNILLVPDDPIYPLRVIDWGIAHTTAGARYTSMNEAIGTPTYMAPEQARGGPTDGHCDVYGLGIVAYQALTGRPPFVGTTSVEILVQHLNKPIPALAPRCPDAPYGFVELVERMLEKPFEDRPSASDVQAAVDELRDDRRPAYAGADATGPVPREEIEGDSERTAPTLHLRPH
jgi:serine/threonine protein kinase